MTKLSTDTIISVFCTLDDFYQAISPIMETHAVSAPTDDTKKTRKRKFTLSDSEVMTIMVLFHLSGFRDLKTFYLGYVQKHLTCEFPKTVSYNRFVELEQRALLPLFVFLQLVGFGKCTGVSFIDSTPLRVCHIKREHQHRVFKGLAGKGKCSMGWFYGFKLHLVINDRGEILGFTLSPGNVDDRQPLKDKTFHNKIFGKLIADRGYISQDLFEKLFIDGIHLITKIKKNMKNSLMHLYDKILLRKRALIETVNDQLKNICQIDHTRHRAPTNFACNLIAGLVAYCFLDKKPSMNLREEFCIPA